jgi:hypothetical protein
MFTFRSMASEPDQDGQLHTLGLLERLCSETNLVRGAYGGLYERVDKLLREIENPNLHDIRNMSFRVEPWDQHALHIRWVIAACGICVPGAHRLRGSREAARRMGRTK